MQRRLQVFEKSTSTNCRKAVKCIKEDMLLFAVERPQISFSVSVKMYFYPATAYTALELKKPHEQRLFPVTLEHHGVGTI